MPVRKFTDLAIIIGAMKAGTTTLHHYLQNHRQLSVCRLKEPNFFVDPVRWEQGVEHYESLFDFDPARHRYAFEASTDYAKLPYLDYVFERYRAIPEYRYKFIYIMRNPFARIESHAAHADATGTEILSYRPTVRSFSFDDGISQAALQFSRYAYHIDEYVRRFGRNSVHILTLEDLVADTDKILRQICKYLEIDEDFDRSASIHANVKREGRVPPIWRAASDVKPFREFVRSIAPKSLRHALYTTLSRREVKGRFTLNETEKAQIIKFLRDDLRRLQDEYGVDVRAQWGIDLNPSQSTGTGA